MGAFEADHLWVIAVLMISSLLNVAYLLPIIGRGWFAPSADDTPQKIHEAPVPAVAALTITAILCVVLFFAIGTLLDLVQLIETAAPGTGGQNG